MLRALFRRPTVSRGSPVEDRFPGLRILAFLATAFLFVAASFSVAHGNGAARNVKSPPHLSIAGGSPQPIEATSFDWLAPSEIANAALPPAALLDDLPLLTLAELAAVLRGPAHDLTPGDLQAVRVSAPAAPVNIGSAAPPVPGKRYENVNITFYDCSVDQFCGRMYGGLRVYEGAAACSFDLPLGTRFRIVGDPTGHTYRCDDRGLLKNTWVDIFFFNQPDGYNWARDVARIGAIEIVAAAPR